MFKRSKSKIEPFKSFKIQHEIECMAFSPTTNSIIIGTTTGKLLVFNSIDYSKQKEIQVSGFPTGALAKQRIIGILKSKDKMEEVKEVMEMGNSTEFPMGDALKKYDIGVDEIASSGGIKCVSVVHDLKVAVGFNSTLGLIDLSTCGEVVIIEETTLGHSGMVRHIDVFNNKIISLANDRNICIWASDGKLLKTLPRTDEDEYYNTSLLTTQGDLLVSGSRQSKYMNEKGDITQVFEVSAYTIPNDPTNAKFIKYFHHNRTSPHHNVIVSIQLLENGKIITGSQDGVFAIWEETEYRCLFIKINSSQIEYTKLKQNCPVHCAVYCDKLLIVSMRDYIAAFDTSYREVTPQRKPSEEKSMMPFGRYKRDITDIFSVMKSEKKYWLYLVVSEAGEINVVTFDPNNKPAFTKTQTFTSDGKITSSIRTQKSLLMGFSRGTVMEIMF
ncbi:WD domain, G-beta repeat containing protein [Entamoeba histolytica HM-1:IMSS-B]|uniref:WD domain containing protein n=6 Tax=Entamoeba histolytica TaxID=5759 RepID=C4LVT9_ENTH1|nr:WD domain containing protein [Entamoeba histolytica HM-1:IMSS]EMD47820.1 WD domain containing protein [Entamoeba histolytica KU27]EMH76908.1 WD domain, G-beta repeat containing protein [Entamoeba histolytica HM-1:IMSS-B]EMS13379.1 WD domain, G-beta repeat-containing protein [Entamoeba histolytica HM-3:IMSS]ENY59932.1 WD domain, G-beta repeat-containing protein [Entamoeba histolytica HM-1:IMSS-A]GAT92795.1 WD domain containing protein [Entamoeba histolytica]|eukprot:XP_656464.1 WD domain containing protein [Entamoeba histolytica HM-1:IMSS]